MHKLDETMNFRYIFNTMFSIFVCVCVLQNNNLERALDWIFTHPESEEETEAMSDMADTEPNDTSFSNANTHSDSTLSPEQEMSSPRVRDGPGREYPLHRTALTQTPVCNLKF